MSRRRLVLLLLLAFTTLFSAFNILVYQNRYRYQIEYQNPVVLAPSHFVDNPSSAPKETFHKNGYVDSWVLKVEDELVYVQFVDDKTIIEFRPPKGSIELFKNKINTITPVTFDCEVIVNHKCDLTYPYKLYVNNLSVELIKAVTAKQSF